MMTGPGIGVGKMWLGGSGGRVACRSSAGSERARSDWDSTRMPQGGTGLSQSQNRSGDYGGGCPVYM